MHFQFALRYTDEQQNTIVRVITRMVRTTSSLDSYLSTLDINVVAMLISKRSVLLASSPGHALDAVVRDL